MWSSIVGTKTVEEVPATKVKIYSVDQGLVDEIKIEKKHHTKMKLTTVEELYSFVPDGCELIIFKHSKLEYIDHVLTLDDMFDTIADMRSAHVYCPNLDFIINIEEDKIRTKFETSYDYKENVKNAMS